MSLGDLNKSVNTAGMSAYNNQRGRILREGKDKMDRMKIQEADKLNQDLSHFRLQKQTMEGRILQLRSEIAREKNPQAKMSREAELKRMINEKTHLEGEILSKQAKTRF